jgi:hypothetical protein
MLPRHPHAYFFLINIRLIFLHAGTLEDILYVDVLLVNSVVTLAASVSLN